jgi:myosin heavy subunit
MLPLKLDDNRTKEQLKYNGVIEAIRVARQGYPIRIKNNIFDKLYFMIPDDKKEFIIRGKTTTFMNQNDEDKLENIKQQILISKAIIIQKTIKMFLQKKKFIEIKHKIIKIQSIFRMYKQYKIYQNIKKNYKAEIIQKNLRMCLQIKKYNKIKFIVAWITFRRIQLIKLRKIQNQKAIIIQRTFSLFLFKKKLDKLLYKIKTFKRLILLFKAKKKLRLLRKEAKDIGNLKLKLKNIEKQNKLIQEEKNKQQIELFYMLQEEIYMKQLVEKENFKKQLEIQELEKQRLDDENKNLVKTIVNKDMDYINRLIEMEREINTLRKQIHNKDDSPSTCVVC